MDEEQRIAKRSTFGGVEYATTGDDGAMRSWFTEALARRLPIAPLLYWDERRP